MDISTVWSAVLSAAVGGLWFFIREKFSDLKRVEILLSKTREEAAEKYVTKVEVHSDINRVLDRIDRLENKIDSFMQEQRNK